jgi:nitrate/TMAO reductase-like tetraheme cytochrome c subunit
VSLVQHVALKWGRLLPSDEYHESLELHRRTANVTAANVAAGLLQIMVLNRLQEAFGSIEFCSKKYEMRVKAVQKLVHISKKKKLLYFSQLNKSVTSKFNAILEHICQGAVILSHLSLKHEARNMAAFLASCRSFINLKEESEAGNRISQRKVLLRTNSLLLEKTNNYVVGYKLLDSFRLRNLKSCFR